MESKIDNWELYEAIYKKVTQPENLDITFNDRDSLNYGNPLLEAMGYFNSTWECIDGKYKRTYYLKK